MAIANNALENLSQFIEVDPETGCWRWQGRIEGGYGRITIDGVRWQTHRLMYEMYKGPIPPKMVVEHQCHTLDIKNCQDPNNCLHRRCCNPAHLILLTVRQNTKVGLAGQRRGKRANRRY